MNLTTLRIDTGTTWAPASLSEVDSQQTLLLLFGTSGLLEHPDQIRQVLAACPRSHVIGCSTSGEIYGSEITDDTLVVAAV